MKTQRWIYLGAWVGIVLGLSGFILGWLLPGDVQDLAITVPAAATVAMGLCLLGVASRRTEKRIKELLLGLVILIGLAATTLLWIERLSR
jgi:hypothetical protein